MLKSSLSNWKETKSRKIQYTYLCTIVHIEQIAHSPILKFRIRKPKNVQNDKMFLFPN